MYLLLAVMVMFCSDTVMPANKEQTDSDLLAWGRQQSGEFTDPLSGQGHSAPIIHDDPRLGRSLERREARHVFFRSPRPQDLGLASGRNALAMLPPIIEYALAEPHDIPGILTLYDDFDDEDRRHLLVLPREQRDAYFAGEVDAGRVFVTLNTSGGRRVVIGFCRVYVVSRFDELNNILTQELCALSGDTLTSLPHSWECKFNISMIQAQSRALLLPIPSRNIPPFSFDHNPFKMNQSNNVWIYFGTNFIAHPYRGRGIDTLMERWALQSISRRVQNALAGKWPANPKLYYIYGSIDPVTSQGRIRSFAWFIHTTFNLRYHDQPIPFFYYGFQAYKPVLEYRTPTPESPHQGLRRHRSFGRGSRSSLDLVADAEACDEATPQRTTHETPRAHDTHEEMGISGKGCFVGFDFAYAHEQWMGRILD